MKNFIVVLFVILTSVVNAQTFTMLNQSQNKLLDKYGIDYAGLQTRYIMSTNQIDIIEDTETRLGMIKSYEEFMKWKSPDVKILPDTIEVLMTGYDYLKDKSLMDDRTELLRVFFYDYHKVLQRLHFDVYDGMIKSIEIIECSMPSEDFGINFFHMIFIENKYGYWKLFSSDDSDTTLDCPFCGTP